MIKAIAGPRPTVMRTAQRFASKTTKPARRRSAAGECLPATAQLSIALHEHRTEHCGPTGPGENYYAEFRIGDELLLASERDLELACALLARVTR